jgi:amidase
MSSSASPTATEIAAAVRAGTVTARATTDAALARIAARDADIGAFQVVRHEAALREADEVDANPNRADLPLAGVPIPIKDAIPVAGEPMRTGSAGSDPSPQLRDHEVVTRLRAAGAVIVGLTAVPELCTFGATDSTFGVTRNPWDRSRTPGGSSGGAAAAVAAGMVPVAHGTDGMGSIRIPSACCGLVGIKPGFGVVPADLGNGSWFGMSENGPLATTVDDCALMLSVLAGRPELALLNDVPALRIAVSTKSPVQGVLVNRTWADVANDTGALLREAGHTVRQANPPYGSQIGRSGIGRWMIGVELDSQLLTDRTKLEKRTRRHAAVGRALQRAGYPKESGRTTWQAKAERFFTDFDVLLTPGLAQSPISSQRWSERGWLVNLIANARYAPFAAPWNLAGWPAIAVPAGVGADGMPRSVQLVARPGSEALLLALAAQLELLRPWHRVAPDYS